MNIYQRVIAIIMILAFDLIPSRALRKAGLKARSVYVALAALFGIAITGIGQLDPDEVFWLILMCACLKVIGFAIGYSQKKRTA
ncbi:hypothetical protein IM774_06295 [Erysipelotrichaceae bacterium RD49]|nr:hypothetical protein [Erysipelotrichaceae bacterium RD49]